MKLSKFFREPGLFWRDLFIKKYPLDNTRQNLTMKGSDREPCANTILSELNIERCIGIYYSPVNHSGITTIGVLERSKKDFLTLLNQYAKKKNYTLIFRNKNMKKSLLPTASNFGFWGNQPIYFQLKDSSSTCWFKVELWKESDDFYLTLENNYISLKLWKTTAAEHGFFKEGLKDYSSTLRYPHESQITFDIDLVFTWVDSEDSEWRKMYESYVPKVIGDNSSTSRFFSRNELKYALRSWFDYGSFVRNIYIVSNCKPPQWLNIENEKIHWVYHEEIMPEDALPTFNSHAIEACLHKIPNLSNHFIYSNDDFFLGRQSKSRDFFYSNGIAKLRLEPHGNVNGEVSKAHPDYLNAARNSKHLLEETFKTTVTQLHTHSPSSLRVDVLTEIDEKYAETFKTTVKNKFRTKTDINVTSFFAPHYSYLTGKAIQADETIDLIQPGHNFKRKLQYLLRMKKEGIYEKSPLSFCLNDGGDSHLNNNWNKEISTFLNDYFPDKSDYEK